MFSTPLQNTVDHSKSSNTRLSLLDSTTNRQFLTPSGNLNESLNRPPRSTVASAGTTALNGTATFSSSGSGVDDSMYGNSNENLHVTGFGSKKPLELASLYIDHLERADQNTPVLDERSYYNNGLNYNFSREPGGLGAFTPFKREKIINIPDEILQEASKTEIKSDMGVLPELHRCWITIDNKLILWNINDSTDFQSIEEIRHTILNVKLVKPKPNTFVSHIKHLLLISTPFDIYILALSHNGATDELSIYNTGMSVSISGLGSLEIVSYEATGQIFFASKSNGLHIWELQYSSSDDWFNSKCTKVCMTQSRLASLVPVNIMTKIPASGLMQYFFEEDSKYSQENVIQLTVDQSRGIIYSLSSKSIIRAYLIKGKQLEDPMSIEPAYISRIIGTTTARGAAILGKKYLKISKIISVSLQENNNLFLVALTVGGVRLYFNGSIWRSRIEALRLESIKFPPSSASPETIQRELERQQYEQQGKSLPFYSNLSFSESLLLKLQKKSSVLLETTRASTIISPGIFFSAVMKSTEAPQDQKGNSGHEDKKSGLLTGTVHHRLFVSVPDYGILKKHGKYVENGIFLDTTGPIKEIVPLNSIFNATNKPTGYANEFATQYNVENLRVAVLTSSAVEVYRYRTPDEVFESLIDNPLPFIMNYGLIEACSTALYVTCKLNKSELLRSKALTFLTVGIPGVIEIKPKYTSRVASTVSSLLSKPSFTASTTGPTTTTNTTNGTSQNNLTNASFNLDDVTLSPRFYGIALLISRLFRDIWDKTIFTTNFTAKFNSSGELVKDSLNSKNYIISISIPKRDVEYYFSSILVLNEFFETYGDSISQSYAPAIPSGKSINKAEEVAYHAENIAINALIKLVQSIKEALSFLKVLYEESEIEGYENQYLAFHDIIRFVKLDVQVNLSKLCYKDIFAPSESTKSLIRDISLSIINRNLTRGASIESTATTLQERCGSFCSSTDILSFRALEHLKRAKEIGMRDYDSLCYHLDSATKLFERTVDGLLFEKLRDAVAVMLSLNYFPKTIEFLLNIANLLDRNNQAQQYLANGSLANDERKKFFDKRSEVYELVMDALVKVDEKAAAAVSSSSLSSPSQNRASSESILRPNTINSLKDESYRIALGYNDKLFHYHLYDWLVKRKEETRLLDLDTTFILPYLEEKSKGSLQISNLLWIYHSRKSHFFQAAEILYFLALSDFEIVLNERIEYLSRANGFCNGSCPPNQKQSMVQLANAIQELLGIASIQDDILGLVTTDNRIDAETKSTLTKELDGRILPVSTLFNDYAVPLGYHEIALAIFKISDFRNQEEILSQWKELFDSLKRESNGSDKTEDATSFITLLSNVVIKVGRKVHTSEFVFPISELFVMICDIFNEVLPSQHLKPGSVANIFVSLGTSYSKLHYILKDIIETSGSNNALYNREMIWLLNEWYKSDRKLRDMISFEEISDLKEYSVEKDPIERYTKRTGISV